MGENARPLFKPSQCTELVTFRQESAAFLLTWSNDSNLSLAKIFAPPSYYVNFLIRNSSSW